MFPFSENQVIESLDLLRTSGDVSTWISAVFDEE